MSKNIISQLFIYPIKGLAGISVESAMVQEEGFQNDRRLMLVDAEGKFISQRTDARLAIFKTRINDDQLVVDYKEHTIEFSLNANEEQKISSTVWDDTVDTLEVSKKVSAWFSRLLERELRLVVREPNASRYKKLIKGPTQTKVSFADGYPYLIIGTASLEELNTKLERPVNIHRFRGNIIVDTTEAHEEDTWDKITVGDTQLEIIKPCARCQVINIDQGTADKSKEPLKTLATYRKQENKIYFGANSIALKNGVIRVGDEIIKLA